MRYLVVASAIIAWLFSASAAEAYYLDAPHNESNGIYCYTCHSMPVWRNFTNPTNDPDITIRNAVCLTCHDQASSHLRKGPAKRLHASSTRVGSAIGIWTTECTQCHDVHSQGQLDWSATDGASLYLAWGKLGNGGTYTANGTGLPLGVTTISGYTTFPISEVGALTGWDNPVAWMDKGGRVDRTKATDNTRGLIFVPDKSNPVESYEIIDATATYVKVKGRITTSGLSGKSFGIIYGQSIKSLVMPNGGRTSKDYRNVKFFQANAFPLTYGGWVDETPGTTTPMGLCQVCHTSTPYWLKNGVWSIYWNDPPHHNGSDCLYCHKIFEGDVVLN